MNILKTRPRLLLLVIMSVIVPDAFGAGPEIRSLDAVSDGETVRIDIDLTSPVRPIVTAVAKPSRLIIDLPNVAPANEPRQIMINRVGVSDIHTEAKLTTPFGTRIVVGIDSVRPFGIETSGNKLVLSILPHPTHAHAELALRDSDLGSLRVPDVSATMIASPKKLFAAPSMTAPPEVEHLPVMSEIEDPVDDCPVTLRNRFKIKFVSGSTAYIDGGSNAGLRIGMNLDIHEASENADAKENSKVTIGAARIVGTATTSAILEVGISSGDLHPGNWVVLLPKDTIAARENVLTAPSNTLNTPSKPVKGFSDYSAGSVARSFRAGESANDNQATRTAGRIGLDYSGISSAGSSPGASVQLGISFQSNMQRILGTHWNLEGYWRGRINRHSQFQLPTVEDSLNKTYTMQLYYDNPTSRWVAGVGRLYLPWAVSLDTVDGGYFGQKFGRGNTSGIFAGSTPDLSSWHYRPNQRIAGAFTNFEGGDYDRFHYSSTAGVALTSIGWRLDRPFVFFENELSYKGKVSAYHSLIADSPSGVSTNGIRPGAGVSHSYFTLRYQPKSAVSFDLYHNFFRDVPTAVTSVVGTGLVDKLLFQGVSVGTHVRPTRNFTLYTTLGTSEKTGDSRHSLNQMFGATLNEVGHTGLRADFHYSKFNSNFGDGHYDVLSLSRQVTNRMFWNIQLGKQDLISSHTVNCFSKFVDDSLDINLGRHSYLQTGYTYVRGDTMNYRQWYMSWGFRFDEGKKNPQYVQTLLPRN